MCTCSPISLIVGTCTTIKPCSHMVTLSQERLTRPAKQRHSCHDVYINSVSQARGQQQLDKKNIFQEFFFVHLVQVTCVNLYFGLQTKKCKPTLLYVVFGFRDLRYSRITKLLPQFSLTGWLCWKLYILSYFFIPTMKSR